MPIESTETALKAFSNVAEQSSTSYSAKAQRLEWLVFLVRHPFFEDAFFYADQLRMGGITMAKTIKMTLNQINQLTPKASLEHFETDKKGLSRQQRTARLQTYGENTIQKRQQRSLLRASWQSVQDPFIGVLAVLMIISWLSRDIDGAIVMLIMIVVSSSIRFVQERKSEQASIALQAMLAKTSRVVIEGQPTEVAAQSLVPGDIVQLQTGDLVNADLKILASHDLQINQSSLTGESKPVSKRITA